MLVTSVDGVVCGAVVVVFVVVNSVVSVIDLSVRLTWCLFWGRTACVFFLCGAVVIFGCVLFHLYGAFRVAAVLLMGGGACGRQLVVGE